LCTGEESRRKVDETRFNGRKLRAMRQAQGWSQSYLARQAGISFCHVSQLEKGTRKSPSIDMVYQLAEAFNVSIYTFLTPTSPDSLYPDTSIDLTRAEAAESAEDWQRWRRTLHPELESFLRRPDAQAYLQLAKDLYDAGDTPALVFQVISEFMIAHMGIDATLSPKRHADGDHTLESK